MYKDTSINSKMFEEARDYWLNKFSGELAEINLNRHLSGSSQYKKEELKLTFDTELTEKILAIANNNDLSIFVILLTIFKILLFKFTGEDDIVVTAPTLKKSNQNYNSFVALRDFFQPNDTFKSMLMNIRETVVQGYKHQYFPINKLTRLLDIEKSLSLFRMILVLENIHKKVSDDSEINNFENDLIFSTRKMGNDLEGTMIYNSNSLKKETIQTLSSCYFFIMKQVSDNTNIKIRDILLVTEEGKNKRLLEFNNTHEIYPEDKTIHQLFQEQVERTPHHIAVNHNPDLKDIYEELESGKNNSHLFPKIAACCFKKNRYIYEKDIPFSEDKMDLMILKTNYHNSVVVNNSIIKLLNLFNGERNIESIFSSLKDMRLKFLVFSVSRGDVMEIASKFSEVEEMRLQGEFEDFVRVLKLLYRNYLIELTGVISNPINQTSIPPGYFDEDEIPGEKDIVDNLLNQPTNLSSAEVLLLGDTPGMATTGLLYMASYLRRHGIETRCQFTDANWTFESLKTNIEMLLKEINPKIVGVSMKWFLHIARVLEICKMVKEYSPHIEIVVGGNTAAYYWEQIIQSPYIDYIIRGDGERPLLEICKGAHFIPNCIYKKDGKIIENPITYVQDETSSPEIYLSHLDEIMLSKYDSIFGTFFVYTQKGCLMNCLYCAGCRHVQKNIFNRSKLLIRDPGEVRKDIAAAREYASNFKFDFDVADKNLLDYCQRMLAGIDLSSHFCTITNLIPPNPRLIEFINKTFKYVYWNLDLASLSQRHRDELFSLGLVKPQPSDKDIISFLDECEKYENCEFIINLIAGLPYFRAEDITRSEKMLSYIMNNYTCFSELFWARLHAQPGAPVVEDAPGYGMHSYAHTFEDFLKYSEKNFHPNAPYPNVEYSNYPYIYFDDDDFNSKISKHYSETESKISHYKENKRKKLTVSENLTYRELDIKANRLASILRNGKIGQDSIVGIMSDPSIEMIVSMLAVLKAGGAYLPIDPDYPADRKKYMLEDSGAKVLLTQKKLMEKNTGLFQKISIEHVLPIDDPEIYQGTSTEPGTANPSGSLIYAIYTSGSTGKPKGVLVNHKGFVNLVSFHKKIFGENPTSRMSQVANLSFDAMAFEVWPCLLSGAGLYIADKTLRIDPGKMKKWLIDNKITISFQPTVMGEQLLKEEWPDKNTLLKALRVAGDKLSHYPRQKYPFRLYNLYGPTEDTVWTTWTEVNVTGADETHSSIGKPVGNKKVYIMGKENRVQPIGIPGELCVAGHGLSRGYLNNLELTTEKFVEDPFEKGKRMYRTGDRARWLTDGNLEFLGRIDQQVKVRGYRIELGEIENQLAKHEKIKEVLVAARETDSGLKALCAYIVPSSPDILKSDELREFLSRTLPDYMIPASFVEIEKIPLTANGKIDRKSLDLLGTTLGTGIEYVAPRNQMEKVIADIWQTVLKVEKVGVNDNFFDLGGNSMNIIQVNDRLKEAFNMDIAIATMFQYPSISSICNYFASKKSDEGLSEKENRRELLNQVEDSMKETIQLFEQIQ